MNEHDLDAAVRAQVIAPNQADQLRAFVASRRGTPAADEERFRLFDGLGDLMSAAGFALLLGTIPIALVAMTPLAGAVLIAILWALAEKYTRKKKLALTSAVLFFIFVVAAAMTLLHVALLLPESGAAATALALKPGALPMRPTVLPPIGGLVVAAGCALACAAWWLRFRLPIAFAGIVLASINVVVHVARMLAPNIPAGPVGLFLLAAGFAILTIAMWWDMSDIRRETRRSDVAFWLHALAGFQIAGASFRLIFGVVGDPVGWDRLYTFTAQAPGPAEAIIALLLFAAFCAFALVIDRRSLILSSLVFVFAALAQAIGAGGFGGMMGAVMAIGLILVLLSNLWATLRATLLELLPDGLRAQLPRTEIVLKGARPVA
jgi:hypothetical protein